MMKKARELGWGDSPQQLQMLTDGGKPFVCKHSQEFYTKNNIKQVSGVPRAPDLMLIENHNSKLKRQINESFYSHGFGQGVRRTAKNKKRFKTVLKKIMKKCVRDTSENRKYLRNLLASDIKRKDACILNNGGYTGY